MGEEYGLADLLKGSYTKLQLVVGTSGGELKGQIASVSHVGKDYFYLTDSRHEQVLVLLAGVAWIRIEARAMRE